MGLKFVITVYMTTQDKIVQDKREMGRSTQNKYEQGESEKES